MTAYETAERVKEYIRRALPLFEPIEVEYNSGLCELTFETANALGIFGAFDGMPQSLRRAEHRLAVRQPAAVGDRARQERAVRRLRAAPGAGAQIDPLVTHDFDIDTAFREALAGVAPAKWIRPERPRRRHGSRRSGCSR